QPVERVTVAEEGRFGGIQVLRRRVAARLRPGEDAAAEGDHLSRRVGDREDHPLAEAIEDTLAPLAAKNEAGGDRVILTNAAGAEMARERIAGPGGPAESEANDRPLVEAALAQIGAGARTARRRELGAEERRRGGVRRREGFRGP